jgi:hypothetical protein
MTKDGVAEKLRRSWRAGYIAGGRSWRDGLVMRCPREHDWSAYERGWIEGKTERDVIAAKQQEQYRWRAIFFCREYYDRKNHRKGEGRSIACRNRGDERGRPGAPSSAGTKRLTAGANEASNEGGTSTI